MPILALSTGEAGQTGEASNTINFCFMFNIDCLIFVMAGHCDTICPSVRVSCREEVWMGLPWAACGMYIIFNHGSVLALARQFFLVVINLGKQVSFPWKRGLVQAISQFYNHVQYL